MHRFLPGRIMKAFELDDRDAKIIGRFTGELPADDCQSHTSLPHYARCKVLVCNRVHRHGHSTREQAAQNRREPFAGILAPDENAVAFGDAAGGQFACESVRGPKQFGVCPPHCAVAASPRDRNFAGWPRFELEIFEERLPCHGASSVAHSWTIWEWWWDTIAGLASLRNSWRGMGRMRGVSDRGHGMPRPYCKENAIVSESDIYGDCCIGTQAQAGLPWLLKEKEHNIV